MHISKKNISTGSIHLERAKAFGLNQIIIWREPNHLA